MSHGAPGSVVKIGFKPRRQDGRPDFKPGDRTTTYSFIAEMNPEDLRGLRVSADDAKNVGDDSCWGVWKADTRETSSLSVHFPAVVAAAGDPRGTTQAAMLPIFARDMPDDRYETKRPKPGVTLPHGAQRFHAGQTGSVTAAMSEEKQIDVFGADWMGLLVSPGAPGGDLGLSTMIYDVGANGGPHSTRYAPLNRFAVPIATQWGTGVALSLTTGPQGDPTTTALPLIDHASNSIGLGSFLYGGGPLIAASDRVSRPCGKHVHGFDDVGRGIHAAHIAAGYDRGALYLDRQGRDACLKFDSSTWIPQGATSSAEAAFGLPGLTDKGYLGGDGPIGSGGNTVALWTETFLRYDPGDFHFYQKPDGSWGQAGGKWKWQTPVPIMMLSSPGGEYSNPGTFEGTRTRPLPGGTSTGSGGGSGSSGGSGGGSGGGGFPSPAGKPTAKDYQEAERERQRQRRQGGGGDGKAWPPPQPPGGWPLPPVPGPKGGGKPGKNGGKPKDPSEPKTPEEIADGVIEATNGDGDPDGDRIEFYDGAGGRGSLDDLRDDGVESPFGVGNAADGDGLFEDLLPGIGGPGIGLGTGFGLGDDLVSLPAPTPKTGTKPTYGFSETCLQVPNLGFVGYPTSDAAISVGGGGVPAEDLVDVMTSSPLAGYMQASACGEGGNGEQVSIGNGDGWGHSPESAISFLPSWAGFNDYIKGEWDPCRTGSTPAAVARFTVPGGLASVDFAHAMQSPSQATKGGGRISQMADGDGVSMVDLTSLGQVGATAVEVTSGGVEITGSLTNNGLPIGSAGGKNSIGGSGEDGAIDLSANTSYGAVVNATSFQLQATYNMYPAISKPLVVKSTGAYTLNGSVLLEGRAWVEPL